MAMDSYAVHLAMAELFGASVVAVSAYFMQRRTLAELLEFARKVGHEGGGDTEPDAYRTPHRKAEKRRRGRRRSSSSLTPDGGSGSVFAREGNGEIKKLNGALCVDDGVLNRSESASACLAIPVGLPRLQTLSEASDKR